MYIFHFLLEVLLKCAHECGAGRPVLKFQVRGHLPPLAYITASLHFAPGPRKMQSASGTVMLERFAYREGRKRLLNIIIHRETDRLTVSS